MSHSIDEAFNAHEYGVLVRECPTLIATVRQLLDAGQTPERIGAQAKRNAPFSLVSHMVYGAAQWMAANPKPADEPRMN